MQQQHRNTHTHTPCSYYIINKCKYTKEVKVKKIRVAIVTERERESTLVKCCVEKVSLYAGEPSFLQLKTRQQPTTGTGHPSQPRSAYGRSDRQIGRSPIYILSQPEWE